MYNAGWSMGKEKIGDEPDTSKGSFYANPLYDTPGTDEDKKEFPWALPDNIWPKESLPGLLHVCFSVLLCARLFLVEICHDMLLVVGCFVRVGRGLQSTGEGHV